MSSTTDLLYTSLKTAPIAEKLVIAGLDRGPLDVMAVELLAAMIPVATPVPVSGWAAILKYLSQWLPEANRRIDDCGWACVAMFLRALGDPTPINGLASIKANGLSDAPELQAMLKTHGVDSVIEYSLPSLPLAQAVKPYSMLLINYSPLAPLPDTWDKGFSGPNAWHWLIYVGPDPKNANNTIVMDPDYAAPIINGGDHRSVPTAALRSAFRPYGSNPTCTALYVPFGPIALPPAPPAEQMKVNTDHLNIRPTPGTSRAPIRAINRGQTLVVRGAQTVGGFTWAEVISVDGIPQAGYVAREYLAPVSTPVDIPPAPTVPPIQPVTRTKIGLHIGSNAPGQLLIDMAKRLHDMGKPLACVTVISDSDLANKLAPYTTVMFRMVWDGRERYSGSMLDGLTAQQAEDLGRAFYYGAHRPYNSAASAAHYLKFTNETGFHPLDWSFNIGLMKAADADKRKVAIFGDSLSTPTVEQWQVRIPALRYAMANGHAVTVNQYGPYVNGAPGNIGVGDVTGDFTDFGKHPFNLYASVPADCRPPLIIGETGQSDSAAYRDTSFVINDARNYDLLTRQYDYLIGFCYYTVGQWIGKPNASLDYALPQFEALIAAT